eukprot:14417582-Alexandrium_andersonii.AAC.1
MAAPRPFAAPSTPARTLPRARRSLAVAHRSGAPPESCINLLGPLKFRKTLAMRCSRQMLQDGLAQMRTSASVVTGKSGSAALNADK